MILNRLLFAAAFSLVLAVGCSREQVDVTANVRTLEDLRGCTCATVLGTSFEEVLRELNLDLKCESYNDAPSAVEALCLGKVDAMPVDTMLAQRWVLERPDDLRILTTFGSCPYGYFSRKGSPLLSKVNDVVRSMKKSGELDRIIAKWLDAPDVNAVEFEPRRKGVTGKNGVLRIATHGEYEPASFFRKGEVVGFDLDILRRVADELDMSFEPLVITMGAMVPAVEGGKADLGGGSVTITESRKNRVDFTDCYMDLGHSMIGRNCAAADGSVAFVKSLKSSFVRTFVVEERWKMLANGLGVTLLITFLATLFGTVLAFPVWLARTSCVRVVSFCARAYIAVLQGTPVLVILMVLFYIVFGRVNIDGIWIAVIGFGLNLSAYAGEMLRSGISSVPRGQTEAALALGYTPRRAFFRFVLPQAVRMVLPVYRGELIGLLKMTSVVGYIAIGDLTKTSDMIRSRTYESFFPIITTAVIYFVTSWVLAVVLERFGHRLDPSSGRKRKGVSV